MGSTIDELKELVVQTLEKKGVLGKIRAELRASVFSAIDDQERSVGIIADNETCRTLLAMPDGVTAFELVREFLEFCGLDYTASLFVSEANLPSEGPWPEREALAKQARITPDPRRPLLMTLLAGGRAAATPPAPMSASAATAAAAAAATATPAAATAASGGPVSGTEAARSAEELSSTVKRTSATPPAGATGPGAGAAALATAGAAAAATAGRGAVPSAPREPDDFTDDLDDSFVEADPDAKRDLQRLREIERRLQSFTHESLAGLSDDEEPHMDALAGRKPLADDGLSSDHSVSGTSMWEDEIDYVQKLRD